ncbi:LysM peptidoglycan-binding domain-containing protein [Aciduricibacillus chroicocephali]|uniref:C40 family peptidase n=1 Tax=Aciduricibacillus chroicocephali TaxID=3054939 RepID=UPI003263146D
MLSLQNKKMIFSVTATAAIAASFAAADKAEAATYKVKSGDTLSVIAAKYKTTVVSLKSVNKLKSDTIYVGQTLETAAKQTSSTSTSKKPSKTSSTAQYVVQAGDSLSKIAYGHGLSIDELMKLNNLSTTLIRPGQTLKIVGTGVAQSDKPVQVTPTKPNVENKPATPQPTQGTAYTVVSGDTLSGIASKTGITVAVLKSLNNLSSDIIYVGQKLTLKGSSSSGSSGTGNVQQTAKPSQPGSFNVSSLISTAQSQIGTPYVWGGSAPGGFDCSGFIHYAYNSAGKTMSRTSAAGYFNRSAYVTKPQPGDLVFFKDTYARGISHLGIYLGGGDFIHAGGDRVQISNVNDSYWSKHFDSYKRFY